MRERASCAEASRMTRLVLEDESNIVQSLPPGGLRVLSCCPRSSPVLRELSAWGRPLGFHTWHLRQGGGADEAEGSCLGAGRKAHRAEPQAGPGPHRAVHRCMSRFGSTRSAVPPGCQGCAGQVERLTNGIGIGAATAIVGIDVLVEAPSSWPSQGHLEHRPRAGRRVDAR